MRPVVRADGLKCSRTMLHSGSAQVGDAAPVGGGAATPGTTVGGTGTEAASLKGQQDCVLDAVLGGDPQRPRVHKLIHYSPPKSCASSCGKIEPSRSWSRAQRT